MQYIRLQRGFFVPEFLIVIAVLISLVYVAVPTFLRLGKCASLEGVAHDKCVMDSVQQRGTM